MVPAKDICCSIAGNNCPHDQRNNLVLNPSPTVPYIPVGIEGDLLLCSVCSIVYEWIDDGDEMAQIRGTAGYNLGAQDRFGGPGRADATNDPSPLDAIREQTSKIEDWLDTLSEPVKP